MKININKSFRLASVLVFVHLCTVILLLTLPWSMTVLALGVTLILGHAVWTARVFWKGPHRLILRDDGTAVLESAKDPVLLRVVAARHLPGAIQLILKPEHARSRALLLMQDAISVADFHELCARIRQQRLPVPETAADQ